MSEIYSRQKIQEDLQKSDAILEAFSKIVSGKAGYRAIIEKKPMIIKCTNCQTILDISQKFCHECGTKVEKLPN
jgi:rRNA maturation endonuclease Nob1